MFHVSPRAVMISRNVPKDSCIDPDPLAVEVARTHIYGPSYLCPK